MFCKKNRRSYKFRKIHRKTPVPSFFVNKVAGLRPATLLKKRLWHRSFPVNFVKFLRTVRTAFLQNTSGRLLLEIFSNILRICFFLKPFALMLAWNLIWDPPIFCKINSLVVQFKHLWRCSVKKVLLRISQDSQENTHARVSLLIKLQNLELQL